MTLYQTPSSCTSGGYRDGRPMRHTNKDLSYRSYLVITLPNAGVS